MTVWTSSVIVCHVTGDGTNSDALLAETGWDGGTVTALEMQILNYDTTTHLRGTLPLRPSATTLSSGAAALLT